jgi:tetratricopeptide (TPR) repeat protein
MAIALALAATAYVARNDAQRRQAQAEDILGFMLGDLRKKLTTVGRLDLMRAVDDKATGYFATLDPRDMTDRALEEQARSLTGIGQVRLDEGNHDAAMRAFREAHARSTALHQREPVNGQRLFDLAQAEYWIGFVALQQGRLDDAEAWLRRYRDSAIKLAAMDHRNFDWQQEVAYGHYNLAVLNESRGRYAQAEQAMLHALALRRVWSRQRPSDTAVRWSLANTVSWLGTLSAQQGKLAEAENYSVQQVSAISRNSEDEPLHAQWQEEKADALILLAKTQAARGRRVAARSSIATALPVALALVHKDPANNDWQVTPGICRWWQAQLAAAEHDIGADAWAEQAASVFAQALAAEPKNKRVLLWLVKTYQLQAQLALDQDDTKMAGIKLAESGELLATAVRSNSDEVLRQLDVQQLVLTGEHARLHGDELAARAYWQEAEKLLVADTGTAMPFDRLEPLVRTLRHLGRSEEARLFQNRLAAAGHVPLRPWPTPMPSTTQSVATAR